MDVWCNSNGDYVGTFGGHLFTITNSEATYSWSDSTRHEFFGRPCYTPTGVSTYCTLIDAGFKRVDEYEHNFIYATT